MLTESLRDIAANHGWPVCDEAADKIEQLERDLLGHSDYELGKNDGWEACETCHGIVDGVSPHRRAIEAEVRAEAQPQGCTRSHPHENMSAECEAKTVEARRVFWEAQEPTLTLDGMSPIEFIGVCLYDFQQATGCDTAEQYLASKQQPAPCPAPLDESRYCPDCEALQAKVAEQSAEIERLMADVEHYKYQAHDAGMSRVQIARQAERVNELLDYAGKSWETTIAERAELALANRLIEQCEKALTSCKCEEGKDRDHYTTWTYDFDDDLVQYAIAAIAAHRGQS